MKLKPHASNQQTYINVKVKWAREMSESQLFCITPH